MPSIPSALTTPPAAYSTANRRAAACSMQRAYPWLLCASTVIAASFCLMYLTKPVIMASQAANPGLTGEAGLGKSGFSTAKPGLMPNQDRLPGEKAAIRSSTDSGSPVANAASGAFEQTNLRIQHILTAEAPGGQVARIDLDVPVLYQSRNLRWTPAEVAEARELLVRLADYQDKTRQLRSEGAALLESWNDLVARSIPAGDLRADSPTLPTNQQDAADFPRPAGLDTTELIQIQPAAK